MQLECRDFGLFFFTLPAFSPVPILLKAPIEHLLDEPPFRRSDAGTALRPAWQRHPLNEVVLTWLQDAEEEEEEEGVEEAEEGEKQEGEEEEEEGSQPCFWGALVCTCGVSDVCW